jgi:hypothetical protein
MYSHPFQSLIINFGQTGLTKSTPGQEEHGHHGGHEEGGQHQENGTKDRQESV